MASIPQFYSDYLFSTDYSQFSSSSISGENCNTPISRGTITSGAIWGEEKCPIFFDNVGIDVFQPECDVSSPVPAMSFPEPLGSSDFTVPPTLPDNTMGSRSIAGNFNFCGGFQLQDMYEFGEECCGFVQDVKPVYPTASGENWGIQGNQTPAIEDTNIKVGRCSAEERKDKILRYLKKRNQRNFNKTIKYACRKTLADRRVRVRGRFARNNEVSEEEMISKKNDNDQEEKELSCTDAVQIIQDDDLLQEAMIKQDDDWLQEAMASLMYLPYIAG